VRAREVYKITVLGWEKHNPKSKKGYEYFMVSNRIFDDHKIATSTSLERLLYLTILARCSDEHSTTCSATRDQLMTMLGQTRYDIVTALNHLQENQLITWEKMPSLINRIEKNRIESNIIESTTDVVLNTPQVAAEIREKKVSLSKEFSPTNEFELIMALPVDTKERWSRLYPDRTFLEREATKCFGYYKNNPKKIPRTMRGWSMALSSWFERGWPHFVKTIKSEPGSNINWDEIFKSEANA